MIRFGVIRFGVIRWYHWMDTIEHIAVALHNFILPKQRMQTYHIDNRCFVVFQIDWFVSLVFAVLCEWYSLHTVRLKYFPSAIRPFVMGFFYSGFSLHAENIGKRKKMYSIEEQSIKAISTIAWSQIDRLLMAIFIVLGLVVNLLITFLPFSFCHHIPIGFLYATTWSIHFIRKIWSDHFWCRFQHIAFVSAWITAIMEDSFKFTRLSHSFDESEHNAKQYNQGKCQPLFHSRIQCYWSNEFYFYIFVFSFL